MQRLTVFFLLLMSLVAGAYAQDKREGKSDRHNMRQELEDFKMKFIAQEIDLREDQQQRFFELYKKMNEERFKVFKETRRLEKQVKSDKNATDADYENLNKAITEARRKDAEIEKRYDDQFLKIISARQLFKMKDAEEKFRHKMHDMRKNKK